MNDTNQEAVITKETKIKGLIAQVLKDLESVHSGGINLSDAKKSAALALQIQLEMSEFLAQLESKTKGIKTTLKNTEAKAYFAAKKDSTAKLSEALLQQMVQMDKDVLSQRDAELEAEKTYKEWSYLFNVCKDAHLFFRNLGKIDF